MSARLIQTALAHALDIKPVLSEIGCTGESNMKAPINIAMSSQTQREDLDNEYVWTRLHELCGSTA